MFERFNPTIKDYTQGIFVSPKIEVDDLYDFETYEFDDEEDWDTARQEEAERVAEEINFEFYLLDEDGRETAVTIYEILHGKYLDSPLNTLVALFEEFHPDADEIVDTQGQAGYTFVVLLEGLELFLKCNDSGVREKWADFNIDPYLHVRKKHS
jgi:hypothetical protein